MMNGCFLCSMLFPSATTPSRTFRVCINLLDDTIDACDSWVIHPICDAQVAVTNLFHHQGRLMLPTSDQSLHCAQGASFKTHFGPSTEHSFVSEIVVFQLSKGIKWFHVIKLASIAASS